MDLPPSLILDKICDYCQPKRSWLIATIIHFDARDGTLDNTVFYFIEDAIDRDDARRQYLQLDNNRMIVLISQLYSKFRSFKTKEVTDLYYEIIELQLLSEDEESLAVRNFLTKHEDVLLEVLREIPACYFYIFELEPNYELSTVWF